MIRDYTFKRGGKRGTYMDDTETITPFDPQNFIFLWGKRGSLLSWKDNFPDIEDRVKITVGNIIYIFTKSQIEKINEEISEEISEDLADYLQKTEDIDQNSWNCTGLITFTSWE